MVLCNARLTDKDPVSVAFFCADPLGVDPSPRNLCGSCPAALQEGRATACHSYTKVAQPLLPCPPGQSKSQAIWAREEVDTSACCSRTWGRNGGQPHPMPLCSLLQTSRAKMEVTTCPSCWAACVEFHQPHTPGQMSILEAYFLVHCYQMPSQAWWGGEKSLCRYPQEGNGWRQLRFHS